MAISIIFRDLSTSGGRHQQIPDKISIFVKNFQFFWKILKNTLTSGDYLEFAAIPRKICENLDEK